MSKSSLIALVLLGAGIGLHAAGLSLDESDKAELAHYVGGAFDAIAGLIVLLRRKRRDDSEPPGPAVTYSVLLAAVMVTGTPGCAPILQLLHTLTDPAATPQGKVDAMRVTYTAAMEETTKAGKAGLFTDDELARMSQIYDAIEAALDQMDRDVAIGLPLDESAAKRAFQAAMFDMVQYQVRARLFNDGGANGPGTPTVPDQPRVDPDSGEPGADGSGAPEGAPGPAAVPGGV